MTRQSYDGDNKDPILKLKEIGVNSIVQDAQQSVGSGSNKVLKYGKLFGSRKNVTDGSGGFQG